MKTIFKISIISLAFVLITGVTGFSNPCEESVKAFKHSTKNTPDEMTVEYLNAALDMCKEKYNIYKDAARYYKHWYENELNPEKQSKYKKLAISYYEKALKAGKKESNIINDELGMLHNSRSFNKIAFRALRPSSPGAVNTGLDIHINFKRNSYDLTGDTSILDELGEVMMENDSVTISLEGHTDSTGTLEYNNELSVNRASVVQQYIVDNFNIDPSRMQVSGYGYKYLLDKKNPRGRLNRRVEVIKLSN